MVVTDRSHAWLTCKLLIRHWRQRQEGSRTSTPEVLSGAEEVLELLTEFLGQALRVLDEHGAGRVVERDGQVWRRTVVLVQQRLGA